MIDAEDIINLNRLVMQHNSDIGTLAAEIKENKILKNKNVVKVITEKKLKNNNFTKALNFSREHILKENLNIYHHIGVYCYKISALEKFVNLNQSYNEIENKLEQLRALDNNIQIDVALAKSPSIGVDTKEDFIDLKKIMEYKS